MNSIVRQLDNQLGAMAAVKGGSDIAEMAALLREIEEHVLSETVHVYANTRLPFKACAAYEVLRKFSSAHKIKFMDYLLGRINAYDRGKSYAPLCIEYKRHSVRTNLLEAFMRTRIDFPEQFSFHALFQTLYGGTPDTPVRISQRPFGALVMQIEKHAKRVGSNAVLVSDIRGILGHSDVTEYMNGAHNLSYFGADVVKAAQKLQRVLIQLDGSEGQAVIPYELGTGFVGRLIQACLKQMVPQEQNPWHRLFHHLATASAGKPGQKFLQAADALIADIGEHQFKCRASHWLSAVARADVNVRARECSNGRLHNSGYIETHSFNLLKGLLWALVRFHDRQTLTSVALLAEKCFQRVPGQGSAAAATGVGNAALYSLAQSRMLDGIMHLSRLKPRIRQKHTQQRIQKHIEEQVAKRGIKPTGIENVSMSGFGMVEGERVDAFGVCLAADSPRSWGSAPD